MPATIHFQRRANRWLSAWRELGLQTGASTVGLGWAAFDAIDALQQPVLVGGGNLLASLHLVRELKRQQQGTLRLTEPDDDVRAVHRVLPELFDLDDDRPAQPRWRVAAYRLKRAATRRLSVGERLISPSGTSLHLALPTSGLHLSDMLPEARALREHDVDTLFVLLDRRFAEQVEGAGFSWTGLFHRQWSPGGAAAKAAQTALRLQSLVASMHAPIDALDHDENALLAAAAHDAIRTDLIEAAWVADAFSRVVARFSPRLLRVGNPYVLEGRVAARVARAHGLPVAVVEHGTIFANDPKWQRCPAGLVCAWGQPSRRALESCGVPPGNIAVTGAPRFDEIFARFAPGRRESRGDCILVVASGPGDQTRLEHHQALIRIIHEAADLTPEVSWVIKLHPKDRPHHYDRAQGHRLELIAADPTRHGTQIFDLLQRARAAVTERSSAAIDAMAVGVPVISINVWPDGRGINGIEFLERGCTRRVSSAQQLADEARRAWQGVSDPGTDARAAAYADEHLANRGHAAHAVATALLLHRGATA